MLVVNPSIKRFHIVIDNLNLFLRESAKMFWSIYYGPNLKDKIV